MKRLAASLLLFVSTAALPADRAQLMPLFVNGTNEIQIFLEPGSARRVQDLIEIRVHMLFTPSRVDAYDVDGVYHEFGEPVSKVVDTVTVSCQDQVYETLRSDFYNIDAEVIWTLEHEGRQIGGADPSSVSGLGYNVVCQRTAAPKQST